MAKVRPAVPEDAPALLALLHKLDAETPFMPLEPGERSSDPEAKRLHLSAVAARHNSALLVAARDADLIGFIAASGGEHRRDRYTARVLVGVLEAFSGQGIATRLFGALEAWAEERKLRRLELSVMTRNERAVGLYQKLGFVTEGTRREALRLEGVFVDEYYMSKLI